MTTTLPAPAAAARASAYSTEAWYYALKAAKASRSDRQLAAELNISLTAVNQVLNFKYPYNTDNIAARVVEVYANLLPASHWREALQQACEQQGRAAIARLLGYSTTTLSLVLADKYVGDLNKVIAKIEGALMGVEVACPVIGSIPKNRCIEQQSRAPSIANPLRLQFGKTCPSCPNFYNCKDSKEKTKQ